MKYYVYAYLDPRRPGPYEYEGYTFSHEPFYIGRGKGRRIDAHINEAKRETGTFNLKLNKIRKILSEGREPLKIKLVEKLTFEESISIEVKLIKVIGRADLGQGTLVNMTDGGEGAENPSKETLRKISEAHTGKTVSDESRLKMSQAHLGFVIPQETRKKLSSALKNRKRPEDVRKKLSHSSSDPSVVKSRGRGRINSSLTRMAEKDIPFNRDSYNDNKIQTSPRYDNLPKYFSPEELDDLVKEVYSRC